MTRNGNDDEIRLSPKALITFMALLAGGNFMSMYYTGIRTEPTAVRPDPFTGSEGRILSSRLSELEHKVQDLQRDLDECMRRAGGAG